MSIISIFFYTGSSELQGLTDFTKFLNNLGILNWPFLPQDFSFSNSELPIILGSVMANGGELYFDLSPYFVNGAFEENTLKVSKVSN